MWEEKDNALHTSLKFKNFREAFAFMTEVTIECEKLNHHPRWTNIKYSFSRKHCHRIRS